MCINLTELCFFFFSLFCLAKKIVLSAQSVFESLSKHVLIALDFNRLREQIG